MKKETVEIILCWIGIILFFGVLFYGANKLGDEMMAVDKIRSTTLVAEGQYCDASYMQGNFSSSSVTIITFKDGKKHGMRGIVSVDFPKGTYIKIYADGTIRKK